ncbi:DUF6194 family protein [Promicromonospora sukumoe]|uniref:DUF6194 family protein n=1 Tax=Promicromonospora sukumoe TaxID=88382 RepID=UPI00036467E2|nr:DUF6194 family protein [Promicromonospora sukumoe]
MDLSQSTGPTIDQIIAAVRDLDGALVVAPDAGDPTVPELAWGDAFFYYAPDGEMPRNVQPYGTIVTKNYPDDATSNLDPAGRWRVNVHVGRARAAELTGAVEPSAVGPGAVERQAAEVGPATPPDAADVVLPHPVYGAAGWIAVVNPGPATGETVLALLRDAHDAARARFERRA